MNRKERFSVSLPTPLVKEFDTLISRMGYKTRSKAIHDAISAFIAENKTFGRDKNVTGALICLYYRDVKGIVEQIEEEQHRYSSIVFSSLHIALNSKRCMRIFAFRGNREAISRFAKDLQIRRGVRHLKMVIMS